MRLWHYKLIPFLPNSQLLAQWRELNSIFKKQDKHILINYVYEYSKHDLYVYSFMVLKEMIHRNYKIKSIVNFDNYFGRGPLDLIEIKKGDIPFANHHTDRYLEQCFYNLQEKYDRGQKDFSEEQYKQLEKAVIIERFKTWANHKLTKEDKGEVIPLDLEDE